MTKQKKYLITILCLYAITLKGWPGNNTVSELIERQKQYVDSRDMITTAFESSHERSYWVTLESIVKRKSLELTKAEADYSENDIGVKNNKFYSIFPPGLPFLVLPFYLVGSVINMAQLTTYSFIVMCTFGIYAVVKKLLKEVFLVSEANIIIAGMTFLIATTAWGYSITFYQHIPTTLFLVIGMYATWKIRRNQQNAWKWNLLAWSIIGITPYLDYANVFLFIPLGLWLLKETFSMLINSTSLKKRTQLSAGILTSTILLGSIIMLNWKTFGSPYQISKQLINYTLYIHGDPQVIKEEDNKQLSYGLSLTSIPHGIYILLFSYERGLLIYSPILLFGCIGLYKIYTQQTEKQLLHCIIATISINIIFYASFHDPWGGSSYGSRYLIPSMALLSIGIGIYLENTRKKTTLFKIIWMYSAFVALLGALTTNMLPTGDYRYVELYGPPYPYFINLYYVATNQSGSFFYNHLLMKLIPLKYIMLLLLGILYLLIHNALNDRQKQPTQGFLEETTRSH